jgi:hypothetical protein
MHVAAESMYSGETAPARYPKERKEDRTFPEHAPSR